jgi:hypothetical protein
LTDGAVHSAASVASTGRQRTDWERIDWESLVRPSLAACLLMIVAIPSALSRSYDDPVAYCRAVGTIDKPAAPYAGPKLPGWMATALDLQPDQGDRMEWRCAHGRVLACLYGANIPCAAKAVTRRRPTVAITGFCRDNPDATFVPMVVTGHETVVSWACHDKRPVVTSVGAVDREGYAAAYWRKVAPR